MKRWIFAVLFFLVNSVAAASNFSRVDDDIKAYDDHVAFLDIVFHSKPADSNNKIWVAEKIAHMVEMDQYVRDYSNIPFIHSYSENEKKEFYKRFNPLWLEVDAKNTADLKDLLKIHSWFTVTEFGPQTDRKAWLLVQHADQDVAFQKRVLNILANLYPQGETCPANYAYLFDRVAASWNDPSQRKLQRFGTQGKCVGVKKWEALPIEEPQLLDERRLRIGLNSESDYIKQVQELCNT